MQNAKLILIFIHAVNEISHIVHGFTLIKVK